MFLLLDTSTGQTLNTLTDTRNNSRYFAGASVSNGILYTANMDFNLYAYGFLEPSRVGQKRKLFKGKERLFVQSIVNLRRLTIFSLVVVILFSFVLISLSRSVVHASETFLQQADWSTFGFKPQHDRVNTYEHILTPSNVSKLTLDWKSLTGDSLYSSPAIVGGVGVLSVQMTVNCMHLMPARALNFGISKQGILFNPHQRLLMVWPMSARMTDSV